MEVVMSSKFFTKDSTPILAITPGDPLGIGPEVAVKALLDDSLNIDAKCIIIGSSQVISNVVSVLGLNANVVVIESISAFRNLNKFDSNSIFVFDMNNFEVSSLPFGVISADAGRASMEWVFRAGQMCLNGEVNGMATGPINKESCNLAGYKDIGHMEVLQRLSNSPAVYTMLSTKGLRVVHLTTHRPIARVADAVTKDNILKMITVTNDQFRHWGFFQPRIGVAALNPHASDAGLLGDEETLAIMPAINEAFNNGILAFGPIPADVVFYDAIQGKYDVVLAMYHDQGHIPIKIYGFEESISINLGLPFIRTSVDHGTAFDIAGKGIASRLSMINAIKEAAMLIKGQGIL
jgi:4-hydroxythreonine-4-phosphate dehydrogenase